MNYIYKQIGNTMNKRIAEKVEELSDLLIEIDTCHKSLDEAVFLFSSVIIKDDKNITMHGRKCVRDDIHTMGMIRNILIKSKNLTEQIMNYDRD